MKRNGIVEKIVIFCFLVAALALVSSGAALAADQPKGKAQSGFSFAVYGDSRSMMDLPYKADQKEETTKLMVECSSWCFQRRSRKRSSSKDVKLSYDPATGELVQIVMPFMTRARS